MVHAKAQKGAKARRRHYAIHYILILIDLMVSLGEREG